MTSQEIRQQFLDFFKSKQHKLVQSAPVVPFDDPTLLFINAGMNQFKDVFLGTGTRDYKRAADTQKCIRVSGKHNDLEEVGRDTYHHTFFEMLGNWSFGDYYKEEAILWAWELLTDVWKLPKERLWVTVYKTDDEALELWKTKTDINPKHILKFGDKDNFWEMGDTGPCGPCSEIHINIGDDLENPELVNADSPECIEIWNLVFIQYNRDKEGKLNDLPMKHVDTGMGFERVCAVLQDKKSNYETDVFQPLIQEIATLAGIKYELEEDQIAMRVIADHVRTLTFAIADGAVPGNEGRGYVLRRILRRASRFGRKLNLTKPFMHKLVDVLVKTISDVFPEIKENQTNVEKIIKAEEESFGVTLDRGIELFENVATKVNLQKAKVIPGEEVFKLYDTFGFPVDLTNVMAEEKGLQIDEDKFNKLMNEQKERARKVTKDKMASSNISEDSFKDFKIDSDTPTEFLGYDKIECEATVLGSKNIDGKTLIVLNKTPFYVEAGGQINDHGIIKGEKTLDVVDLRKINNQVVHILQNENNVDFNVGQKVIVTINKKRRLAILRNHSATHFLHAALRDVLGTHVKQAGSYVGPDRLRFDFAHFQKLTQDELSNVEKMVNEKLFENIELQHHRNIPFEEAKQMGANMFFGDKYGDKVNVVQFGDFSMEFCGGTHVKNSSQIGLLKIVSESSIASGVRRIEAVTGAGVETYILNQELSIKKLDERIEKILDEKKKLEKELSGFKLQEKLGGVDSIASSPIDVGGVQLFKGKVDVNNMDELKAMGDNLRNKIKSGVGLLISNVDGKVGVVCVVSDDLIKDKKIMAGKVVSDVAKLVDGGGGGRPHLATAGGKDVSKIDHALDKVDNIIESIL
ncbi:MAG: alanine--tRNA ligase [Melioribacteraceae bacterium]